MFCTSNKWFENRNQSHNKKSMSYIDRVKLVISSKDFAFPRTLNTKGLWKKHSFIISYGVLHDSELQGIHQIYIINLLDLNKSFTIDNIKK
jgi:hypothetical protein